MGPKLVILEGIGRKSAQDTEYRAKNKEDKRVNKTSAAIELP